ncbi:hypothetical protein BB12_07965 [Salmonella enterica subsp. diarizonae]|uniref:Uncharacterized protein n=2 Tax=Salmonella enterica TaxID=28901 RepID=A0A3V3KGL3_SALER|nr:hypothetical protein [Salmonella enterica]AXC68587.1 hypothetical protein DOE63_26000 [Salmonella enterica subsp. diarizonae serovar 59:z10:-]EII7446407.1 hypothetical protein [Salmonella enterica subsp. enterica serovar Newport]EKN5804248.1 hypothetical protein [Salmonella enterica subsp. enterica]WGI51396.1 hypothetical protein QBX66_08450 [Salmonella enterica subsp. diarizonae serovar 48:i:z]ATW54461.1 hypothetical protein CNQ75_07935 [Salmonella enterica subsp. diarizonae]
MATTAKTINRNWQQITDGTQSVLVQIIGSADVCDSPVKPGDDQPAHSFGNTELTITPPTVLWIRSSWFEGNIRVVVS